MILARLEQADCYLILHGRFPAAIDFLRGLSATRPADGRIEIGGGVYAVVSHSPLRQRSAATLEAHRKYIDIQYIISGVEEMGWRARRQCRALCGDYDVEKDIEFFGDDPSSYVTVQAGEFVLFFPDDAHAPLIGTGVVEKVVVKVPV